MSDTIRFRFAPEKAKAAILLLLEKGGPNDLHALLKTCYFADREHLNKHGRPIFGARYRAMRFGPVPLEIYEMLKCEPMWLAELGSSDWPWRLDGYRVKKVTNETADLDNLSRSDVEAIESAYRLSAHMTFDARTAATHGADWRAANLGMMRYEDMIGERSDKAELVAYLRGAAPYLRL